MPFAYVVGLQISDTDSKLAYFVRFGPLQQSRDRKNDKGCQLLIFFYSICEYLGAFFDLSAASAFCVRGGPSNIRHRFKIGLFRSFWSVATIPRPQKRRFCEIHKGDSEIKYVDAKTFEQLVQEFNETTS